MDPLFVESIVPNRTRTCIDLFPGCASQPLCLWGRDTLTAGAEHETSAGLLLVMAGCKSDSPSGEGMGSPDAVVAAADPVAALEDFGGRVERDTQSKVIEVRLFRTKINDAELVHLGELSRLQPAWPWLPCA